MGLFGRKKEPRRHKGGVAELVPVPDMADLPKAKLQSPAKYLGTLTESGEKVVGQSLSVQSSARLNLAPVGIDVVRMAGSFRIPAEAMRGATTGEEFAGKRVDSLLVVRWEHDDQPWRTGFRMDVSKNIKSGPSAPDVDQWVRTISKMARKAGETK
jgi:hypothetical protein